MSKLFYYKRKFKDKDNNEVVVQDALNTDYIIRVYTISEDNVVVLLADGHEDGQYVEVPKSNGKGIEIKKERRWVQSEITLDKEDADRLKNLAFLE